MLFSVCCCRKSIPKFFYKLYQHLRDKDDENDEDDNDDWNRDQTKQLSRNLQELDGITGEHARVIEESDIITTFLNKNGEKKKSRDCLNIFYSSVPLSSLPFSMFFLLVKPGNTIRGSQNETHLSFDLSEVSTQGTSLMLSDLHLFKRRMPEKKLGSNLCQITICGATFING